MEEKKIVAVSLFLLIFYISATALDHLQGQDNFNTEIIRYWSAWWYRRWGAGRVGGVKLIKRQHGMRTSNIHYCYQIWCLQIFYYKLVWKSSQLRGFQEHRKQLLEAVYLQFIAFFFHLCFAQHLNFFWIQVEYPGLKNEIDFSSFVWPEFRVVSMITRVVTL